MNGFLAGVGEYGSTRFLAVTLLVTPHLHQRSRAIARRISLAKLAGRGKCCAPSDPLDRFIGGPILRWFATTSGRFCVR